jgi:hypothetical protein
LVGDAQKRHCPETQKQAPFHAVNYSSLSAFGPAVNQQSVVVLVPWRSFAKGREPYHRKMFCRL